MNGAHSGRGHQRGDIARMDPARGDDLHPLPGQPLHRLDRRHALLRDTRPPGGRDGGDAEIGGGRHRDGGIGQQIDRAVQSHLQPGGMGNQCLEQRQVQPARRRQRADHHALQPRRARRVDIAKHRHPLARVIGEAAFARADQRTHRQRAFLRQRQQPGRGTEAAQCQRRGQLDAIGPALHGGDQPLRAVDADLDQNLSHGSSLLPDPAPRRCRHPGDSWRFWIGAPGQRRGGYNPGRA